MRHVRTLRFKTRLKILTLAVAVGVIGFAGLAISTLNQVKINGELYQKLLTGRMIDGDFAAPREYILDAQLAAAEMVLSDDPYEQRAMMGRFDQNRRDFEAAHTWWMKHAPGGALGNLVTQGAYGPGEKFFQIAEQQFLPAVRAGNLKQAQDILNGDMQDAFLRQRIAIGRILTANQARNNREQQLAAKLTASRQRLLIGAGVALLLLVAGLGLGIARGIAGTMQEAITVLGAVADGDLRQRLEVPPGTEVAAMAESLNGAVAHMGTTVAAMARDAAEIAQASERVAAMAHRTAEGAEEQKDQSNQVAAALQEMTATMQDVSVNAEKAAGAARHATATSREGAQVVEQTVAKIQDLAQSMDGTAGTVRELGRSSEAIGAIVEVIDEIAEQTNMLALNAAIEAARAGEQGRSFAVVADEVRKLAERTASATREIASMVGEMQAQTGKAMAAMTEGQAKVGDGVEAARAAGESLQAILRSSGEAGEMVTLIAAASAQQSVAVGEVAHRMEHIARVSSDAAQGAEESQATSQTLFRLARDLEGLVGRFHVEEAQAESHLGLDGELDALAAAAESHADAPEWTPVMAGGGEEQPWPER